jgi:heterodisulfide reductase subunit B
MKIEGKQHIWKDYQKEIPDDHFFYVRSCIRQNFFPGSEKAFLRILQSELQKDIYENPSHTTCSGIGYHADIVPFATSMTMVARQFALMTEAGYENLATSCITSFGLYSEVLETWHHFPETLAQAREFLHKATGREFKIPGNVSHASDIIFKFRKEISEKGKYRLINKNTGQPLHVVEHIGCHYSKMFPSKGVGGAEYPYVLIGMIEEWGGEVIDYPERRHCCGFGFRQYLVQANRGFSVSCSKKKFDSMEPYKPDMILTNCPGCPMFLDRWQYAISEMEGKTYGQNGQGIPVLTYEELAGLVLGYNPWDLGLQVHQVPVEPLLDKIGIPYDPEMKFKGKDGQDLGKPEAPSFLKFYPEKA